jgi:hypothetical protein
MSGVLEPQNKARTTQGSDRHSRMMGSSVACPRFEPAAPRHRSTAGTRRPNRAHDECRTSVWAEAGAVGQLQKCQEQRQRECPTTTTPEQIDACARPLTRRPGDETWVLRRTGRPVIAALRCDGLACSTDRSMRTDSSPGSSNSWSRPCGRATTSVVRGHQGPGYRARDTQGGRKAVLLAPNTARI